MSQVTRTGEPSNSHAHPDRLASDNRRALGYQQSPGWRGNLPEMIPGDMNVMLVCEPQRRGRAAYRGMDLQGG